MHRSKPIANNKQSRLARRFRRPRLDRWVWICAAAAWILYGLLGPAWAANDQPIVVGMSAAFSGPTRSLGIELYRGSAAYLEHINRQGGIGGRLIVIKAYDDGYNPLPALENTLRLINEDRVFVLFNYVGTPTVTRILPLLKKFKDRHIYLLFPFTGAQPQRIYPYNEFVFNLRASYRQETQGLIEHLLTVGRERIGVFYQADAYGRSGWDGVRRALAAKGLKMVAEATYRRGTPFLASMQRQVEILRASRPDAIVSIGSSAACAAFIRDARDTGWQVPIANLSFVDSDHMAQILVRARAATAVDYTVNLINSQVVPSHENHSLAAVRQYRHLMTAYPIKLPTALSTTDYVPMQFSAVSFEGFLNAKVLVELLRRMQGQYERNRIKTIMEQMSDFDIGIDRPVRFAPHNNQGLDSVYYTTVAKDRCIPLTSWGDWAR